MTVNTTMPPSALAAMNKSTEKVVNQATPYHDTINEHRGNAKSIIVDLYSPSRRFERRNSTSFDTNHLQRVLMRFAICFLSLISYCQGRVGGNAEPVFNMFGSSIVSHPSGVFEPLDCNKDLQNDPCLRSWSSMLGHSLVFDREVVIPCGTCIVMTKPRGVMELRRGLVILGKLVFPDGLTIQMRTTFIRVHGTFVIESSKPIDGVPDVTITWTGTDAPTTFLPPLGQNEDVCGGSYRQCDMKKKALLVAGGQLDFRALPSPSMPSWVSLYDVDDSLTGLSMSSIDSQSMKFYNAPPTGCPDDGILLHHDFSIPLREVYSGSFGSFAEWTPQGSLKVTNRTHTQHCFVVDLKHVRNCLVADQTYLLTARILLTDNGRVDSTECARSGENCMSIYQARLSETAIGRTTLIWKEEKSFGSMLGEETTISVEFNFTTKQLHESDVYEVLQLRGPGPEVDMELLEFTLRTPPKEAFPNPENVCGDLVPGNGDAEQLGLSPYPFRTNNYETHLSIGEESSNHYFAISGRGFAVEHAKMGNWRSAGITWDVPPVCVKPHAKYRFKADIRMHSLRPVLSTWKIKGFISDDESTIERIVDCPHSEGIWVTCHGEFEPSQKLAGAKRFEVLLETDASSYDVSYDVDNVSFEVVEGPLDRLILPKVVENMWNPGSEILMTSHTTTWDAHQVRIITSVENHDEEGYVRVNLNEPIDRPLTLGSNPFHATEVALLSRNVVFNGTGGGHLSVLHTQGQTQVIQGIQFDEFGEEGVRDVYPIHFDFCQDSVNSVVSKNTIRRSNHRCVVLEATSNVLVEGNVAFDTKGHCFVVETGMEIGNVFKSNLGAKSQMVQEIMPQAGVSGRETDETPATFWIGSPSNYWIDNVAAGSEGFGYWFQIREQSRGIHAVEALGKPCIMELTQFIGNTAHSTNLESLKISGYTPTKTASIDHFRSYLNNKGHFVVSNSTNIATHGALLDTELQSNPLPMSRTTIVPVTRSGGFIMGIQDAETRDTSNHGHASDPTDVFNLQSSPSLT
jgi:hypothetical protein